MDNKEDERREADLLAEEFTGQPVNYGSTAKAIKALQKRILDATRRLNALQQQADPSPTALRALRTELARSESDLARYRLQQAARN